MRQSREKHVLFDAMGVLFVVGDDVKDLLIPFIQAKNPAARPEEIAELYRLASLGKMSTRELWEKVGLGAFHPYIDIEYIYTQFRVNRQIYSIIPALRNRYTLSILSNDVSEWSAMLRRKYLFDEFFAHAFISGDIGVRKPSREIYTHALARLDCAPEDCVFIDDRRKNLEAARELGMKTVLFTGEDGSGGGEADGGPVAASMAELPSILERTFGMPAESA